MENIGHRGGIKTLRRIGLIVLVSLLTAIFILPSITIAELIAGTETVNRGEYWHAEIPIIDTSEIYIIINVINGIPVDVFLFDEENFELYRNNESYEFILEGSRLNTSSVDITITLEVGTYFLVVDNTEAGEASPSLNNSSNNVTFTYNINYPALQDMLCFVGVIAIIIIVILIIVLIVRNIRLTKMYQQPDQQKAYYCLTCGQQLRYLNEYKRWYCDSCRKYM